MADSNELLRLKSVTLNHESQPSDDVCEAIKNTILGNPDGMRYRHLDSIKKIKEIKPLQFFVLRRDHSLLYVMALVERITQFRDNYYYTYNVRYVTFNQLFAAKTLTDENNSSGYQKLGNSFLKEGMRKYADTFEFSLKHPNAVSDKRLYYAYVEDSNLRSMNFTGFFFEPVRKFSVITYSNIFPKADKRVSKITRDNLANVTEILNSFYINHSFYFIENEDILNNYFILKENNEIVAGVKAQKANWELVQLPGKTGKFIIKALPHIPLFNRILKPGRFSFLTFDTIYCPAGNEIYLNTLFESVCAMHKTYAAMIYTDSDDVICKQLTGLRKMGILNKLFKSAHGAIMARFINFSDDEKEKFYKNPVYVSGYDMT